MMRSLFSAVSGLNAHQLRMDVIGNNIANINTPGFKKSRVTFQDMLYQTIRGASRGTNPVQVGPGVTIASIDTICTPGNLQNTGKTTDLGIDGDGFFVLSEDGGRRLYTRVGNFDFDSNGYLVSLLNGMKVQGWLPKNSSADIRNIQDDEKKFGSIKVNFQDPEPAKATSEMVFAGNLDFRANNGILLFSSTETTTARFNVEYSDGTETGEVEMRLSFTPTSKFNTWKWEITALRGGTIIRGGSGTVTLDSEGKVAAISTDDGANAVKIKVGDGEFITVALPAVGDDPGNFVKCGSGGSLSFPPDFALPDEIISDPFTLTYTGSDGTPKDLYIDFSSNDLVNWNWEIKDSNGNLLGSGAIELASDGTVSAASGSAAVDVNGDGTPDDTIQPPTKGNAPTDFTCTSGGSLSFPPDFALPDEEKISTTLSVTYTASDGTEKQAQLDIDFSSKDLVNWNWEIKDSNGNLFGSGTIELDPNTGDILSITGDSVDVDLDGDGVKEFRIIPFLDPSSGELFYLSPVSVSLIYSELDPTQFTPPGIKLEQTVYDASGNTYNVAIRFIKRDENGNWDWEVESITNSKGETLDATTNEITGSGSLKFDGSGKLISGGIGTITFDPDGTGYLKKVAIDVDFSRLTQYAAEFTAVVESQDGYPAGTLESYTIDQTGTIIGVYSNGVSRGLAQIALARFTNPAGLTKEGSSLFSESSNSGDALFNVPGAKGYGTIKPGSIEMSNVDISAEFAELIITQRGFQANSRVITASDEMLQELVNLKR
ncbi:MAG: Flagellar hook-basal body protein [Thermoanaerobacterales bacterium 50_218]|nr:MAG: Flagellar hook-basal body protein [Thermoanaerobacterales bacterium 50_218]